MRTIMTAMLAACAVAQYYPKTMATMGSLGEVELSPYPGYSGDLVVQGHVGVLEDQGDLVISWAMFGLESKLCYKAPEGVANACGVHIHSGETCDDADQVGGHFYDSSVFGSDPWAPEIYSALAGVSVGGVRAKVGKGFIDVIGKAVVVHDHTGVRVACGLIKSRDEVATQNVGTVYLAPYPDYNGDLQVAGHVTVERFRSKGLVGLQLFWSIDGLENQLCLTVPAGVANACGMRVHKGETCDDSSEVGGHLHDEGKREEDPWHIVYTATGGVSVGGARTVVGMDNYDVLGHALVVRDSTGERVACGIIKGFGAAEVV